MSPVIFQRGSTKYSSSSVANMPCCKQKRIFTAWNVSPVLLQGQTLGQTLNHWSYWNHTDLVVNNYRPQLLLRKGNVFTPVCDSVHGGCLPLGQGGVCLWVQGVVYLWVQGVYTLGRHPPARHSRARHPPVKSPPGDGHCSKWYASYWNAFLFWFYH